MSGPDDGEERAVLGRALAQARERRGLSIPEVAAAINLRATVVRAIEQDDFSLCGGDVYARGHLRAYARHLGLDEGPLLEDYQQRVAGQPTAAAADREQHTSADTVQPALADRRWAGGDVPLERSGPNWTVVAAGALAVLMTFLGVQLFNDLRGPGRSTQQVAVPGATSTASGGETTTSARPTSTASAVSPTLAPTSVPATGTAPPADGVAVGLHVTESTWVSVRTAGGHMVFSGLMAKGDARRFTDHKQLRLTLGNAGAVQLTVNGKSIGSAGDKGQVVKLRFGPGDPA